MGLKYIGTIKNYTLYHCKEGEEMEKKVLSLRDIWDGLQSGVRAEGRTGKQAQAQGLEEITLKDLEGKQIVGTIARQPGKSIIAKLEVIAHNDQMRDALDHIVRVCKQSTNQTRRTRWIQLRAECALGLKPSSQWRNADLPKNGESEKAKLLRRIRELESMLAESYNREGNV